MTDEFLWLEDVTAEAAMTWVAARNAETLDTLTHTDRFTAMRDEIRRLLDADNRIPWPAWHREHYCDFWQDTAHPRGVWRRTTPEQYGRSAPEWEILLDARGAAVAVGASLCRWLLQARGR